MVLSDGEKMVFAVVFALERRDQRIEAWNNPIKDSDIKKDLSDRLYAALDEAYEAVVDLRHRSVGLLSGESDMQVLRMVEAMLGDNH